MFHILKFLHKKSILVKFGISLLLGYSSLAYFEKKLPTVYCITYNLFVYIFQNSFKYCVIVVTT